VDVHMEQLGLRCFGRTSYKHINTFHWFRDKQTSI